MAGFTGYTPNAGIAELREEVAKKLNRFNGIAAGPENVIITTGGSGALYTSLLTLCDPGDGILISDPTWPNYGMMAALQGLEVRRYTLRAEDGWLPNPDEVEKAITPNCRVLLLVSPSNPTGTLIGEERMRELLEVARRHDLWVISDEVYDAITFGKPAFSAYHVGPDRVISIFSFSQDLRHDRLAGGVHPIPARHRHPTQQVPGAGHLLCECARADGGADRPARPPGRGMGDAGRLLGTP